MYRILVADDEGIMLEAFKNVISSTFGDSCIVETAKTGRAVTEIAETFHPDIVFMDIHMPGINGIQAMREIRKFNTTALFYVVSAYDKFDYAKEAIDLGVERYLTKPISKAKIIAAVEEATAKVDTKRNQRSNLLRIQEKLETVIPVVENSFVGSLLFQQEMQVADYYQQLLDIEEKQGYVMIIQFGQSYENGRLVSPVGMNVKAQDFYAELRDIVKSSFSCAVGSIMSNRIPIVVPCALSENPYEERIDLVEQARSLITRLEDRIEAKFRVGIGRVREMQEMERSYREALRALNGSKSRVIHIEDLSQNGVYDEEFPVEMEKNIFRYLEEGKEKGYVTTMFGRRRPIPELKSGNFMQRSFGERVAMNSPIQGTAADIIKIAMNRVYRRLKDENLKSRLVLQVHDELLIETCKEEIPQVSAILEEEMKGAAKLSVELEVDMHQGNNWYEAK